MLALYFLVKEDVSISMASWHNICYLYIVMSHGKIGVSQCPVDLQESHGFQLFPISKSPQDLLL